MKNNFGEKKVVLMSGNFGIGKIIFVKLVSKMLGYEIIEVLNYRYYECNYYRFICFFLCIFFFCCYVNGNRLILVIVVGKRIFKFEKELVEVL